MPNLGIVIVAAAAATAVGRREEELREPRLGAYADVEELQNGHLETDILSELAQPQQDLIPETFRVPAQAGQQRHWVQLEAKDALVLRIVCALTLAHDQVLATSHNERRLESLGYRVSNASIGVTWFLGHV